MNMIRKQKEEYVDGELEEIREERHYRGFEKRLAPWLAMGDRLAVYHGACVPEYNKGHIITSLICQRCLSFTCERLGGGSLGDL